MIPLIQRLLHGISHVSPASMMTSYLALFKIHISRIITPINRQHPPIIGTHHIHIHGLLVLIVELIVDLYRLLLPATPLRDIIRIPAIVAGLICWLLYHSLSIQVHRQVFQPLDF